jgi:hypothetical protein
MLATEQSTDVVTEIQLLSRLPQKNFTTVPAPFRGQYSTYGSVFKCLGSIVSEENVCREDKFSDH